MQLLTRSCGARHGASCTHPVVESTDGSGAARPCTRIEADRRRHDAWDVRYPRPDTVPDGSRRTIWFHIDLPEMVSLPVDRSPAETKITIAHRGPQGTPVTEVSRSGCRRRCPIACAGPDTGGVGPRACRAAGTSAEPFFRHCCIAPWCWTESRVAPASGRGRHRWIHAIRHRSP